MISSKDINFSKYSIINEQNSSLSTNLEIIDSNKSNQEKASSELSQILVSEEQTQKNSEKNNNISLPISQKQELSQPKEETNQTSVHNLLYGNPIDTLNPKFIGKSHALLYDFEGNPKLTIGPDCKFVFLYKLI